ncbi:unnamed protein product, partial [Amoebophrya sp. A25]
SEEDGDDAANASMKAMEDMFFSSHHLEGQQDDQEDGNNLGADAESEGQPLPPEQDDLEDADAATSTSMDINKATTEDAEDASCTSEVMKKKGEKSLLVPG